VRRSLHRERYAPLIDALYDGSKIKRQKIKTEVTFEDGRRGAIEGDVEIRDMKRYGAGEAAFKEAAE
jgi:long-chain acyl-CoA synthetase